MQYIIGISITIFIAALLATKKGKVQADIILMIWMLLNALHLALQYTNSTGVMIDNPALYGLVAPLPLLHGVCLYFYVASVTDQFPRKRFIAYTHLLPALLAYLYLLANYFFLPIEEQRLILKTKGQGHETYVAVLFLAVVLSGVAYVIWSIILLRKHRLNIRDRFSELEKINLRWLQFLIYGLAAVWLIVIFSQNDDYIYAAVVVFVTLTGFFGIQQVDIFKKRESNPSTANVEIPKEEKTKYAKSGLNSQLADQLYLKLNDLTENEKIYKQQELSIGDLAQLLNTHPNYLSQVINERTGKSFYDYINTFRVEDFKKLVADPKQKQFTMLSLAYECGFNSKSSFNRYFKKATDLTPTQYINQKK